MTTVLLNEKAKRFSKEDEVIQVSYREVLEKLNEDVPLLEEPPAWHEAVLKEREKEWEQREMLSRTVEEVFRDLKTKSRGN